MDLLDLLFLALIVYILLRSLRPARPKEGDAPPQGTEVDAGAGPRAGGREGPGRGERRGASLLEALRRWEEEQRRRAGGPEPSGRRGPEPPGPERGREVEARLEREARPGLGARTRATRTPTTAARIPPGSMDAHGEAVSLEEIPGDRPWSRPRPEVGAGPPPPAGRWGRTGLAAPEARGPEPPVQVEPSPVARGAVRRRRRERREGAERPLARLEARSWLHRAILYGEILGPPRALRDHWPPALME